jgi:hypothetical protein
MNHQMYNFGSLRKNKICLSHMMLPKMLTCLCLSSHLTVWRENPEDSLKATNQENKDEISKKEKYPSIVLSICSLNRKGNSFAQLQQAHCLLKLWRYCLNRGNAALAPHPMSWRSTRSRSKEMDCCQCSLIRVDAITVLEGKPYVHLRVANFPAAIPINKWQGVFWIWTTEDAVRARLVQEPNHGNASNSKPSLIMSQRWWEQSVCYPI